MKMETKWSQNEDNMKEFVIKKEHDTQKNVLLSSDYRFVVISLRDFQSINDKGQ